MRTRAGIELTPVACRIVEVAEGGRIWRTRGADSVVRAFGVLPASSDEARAALAALRGKAAAVVVWGTASTHCQVEVTLGAYEAMRAEALRTLDDAGVPTRGAWADIAPAGPSDGVRRSVVVTTAPAPEMVAALQPLVDAGIRVQTVITPAAALAAIARSRRASANPDAVEAYVALEETATCVVLIRGGALIAARDLPWGFIDEYGDGREPRRREDIVTRLGDDLADFFALYDDVGRVSQVCICGGLPELRTTTLPLMERLDVEVETLDSLSGIDARLLPEPADQFRDRLPELRLAWAAAAGWTTINLLRARRRRTSHAVLSRAAVVAGIATGFGSAWSMARTDSFETPAPSRAIHAAVNAVPPSLPPIALKPPAIDEEPPPRVQEPTPLKPELTPPILERPPMVQAPPPPVQAPPPQVQAPPPAMYEPPPFRQEPPRSVLVPRPAPPPTIRSEPPAIRHEPPLVPPTPRAIARPRAVDAPSQFEAVLSGILFSPDRQLAIIDGRVVARGDDVRGATVVEISAAAVLLRDPQGRLRRLSAGGNGR